MRLGIYTRVSTDTQTRGESLHDQRHDGTEWAARAGHDVVAVYTDPGRSGTLPAMERPGLLDALDAVASGTMDGLVVRDLDRLARALTVQEAVLAQVWSRPGTEVFEYAAGRAVLRDDPDDPMRTALRQMQGVFFQLDRAMTIKKLRDARTNKTRKGMHANGPAPYGWVSVDGELHPIPGEQATLDALRALHAEGLNQTEIANVLNASGHRTREGAPWSQPIVSRVIRRDAARTPERVAYEDARLATIAS